jgi:hypothetical protein
LMIEPEGELESGGFVSLLHSNNVLVY